MTAPTAEPAPAAGLPPGRYGPARGARRRTGARVGLALLGLLAAAVVAWLAYAALTTPVRWDDVGYDVTGDDAVQVTFDVTKEPGATVVCRVHALSHRYTEVGVQTVTVGPAEDATQRVTTTVPTAETAVTALVESCEGS